MRTDGCHVHVGQYWYLMVYEFGDVACDQVMLGFSPSLYEISHTNKILSHRFVGHFVFTVITQWGCGKQLESAPQLKPFHYTFQLLAL
jgi:hypothetical protein